MDFASWIDQQIEQAAERGAFDNLPGAGKPLPNRGESDDGLAWLREKLHKEGLGVDELLPAPLKLRKQAERLSEAVPAMRSEQGVRDAVAELNQRIMEWRRIPVGPDIYVRLVDEEAMVGNWRAAQPEPGAAADADQRAAEGEPPSRRRWRRPRRRTPR
jgi:hypothetical protein